MVKPLPAAWLLVLAACAAPASSVDAGGIQGTGGKTFNGPPSLELGTGETAFAPLVEPHAITLQDLGDGGWALPLAVRALNVNGDARMTFVFLDGASLAPVLPPVELAATLLPVQGACLGLGLRVPVSDVTLLQQHPVFWLDVQLLDGLMRQAHARARVTPLGGPPLPDGGALDADASTVGMDAAVGG
jgi:hypothetical protein